MATGSEASDGPLMIYEPLSDSNREEAVQHVAEVFCTPTIGMIGEPINSTLGFNARDYAVLLGPYGGPTQRGPWLTALAS